ncbi:MAG TPA: HAMP domain-containing sensor histidine kinase [Longimicrobiaceae bacterium]|nr:HAMP domain-containing sensor histidine kinase [Longimicrobiaceae bacterium]
MDQLAPAPPQAAPPPTRARTTLAGALASVAGAADPADALEDVLAAAVDETGAAAGGLLDSAGGIQVCAGCAPETLRVLAAAGGPLAPADGHEADGTRLVSIPGVEVECGATAVFALNLALRSRGEGAGTLVLLFAGGAEPGPAAVTAAESLGAVAALVMENARLFEAARLAEQSQEHFLVALNHELRTPATGLVLESDLLRSGLLGDLPPRVGEMLLKAESHVEEIIRVLEGLRELGKLAAQASPERSDVVDPRAFVADLLRRVEPTAKRKGLRISLFVPPSLPPLQTDPSRLGRVLLHLFSNAIRFTAQGEVEVRLERSTVSSGLKRVPVLVARVRDTGPGIPADRLDSVFEPFTQVDEGARSDSKVRGVGLGLPLARKLARSLGGDVGIASRVGVGTTATLTVPYHPRPGA